MNYRSVAAGLSLAMLAGLYIASYVRTSRKLYVTAENGRRFTLRLMGQRWQGLYRPLAAAESALRGDCFGVAFKLH